MNSTFQTAPEGGVVIRPAESTADFRACQEAQRRAWGIADDSYIVPIATLVGAQRHGGLVLGAFLPDGSAVATSFAFLGRLDGRICLYSQLTGVVPGYQSLGLGYQVKLAQRRFAEAQGIPVVVWAFDPLQAGNARFNLDKLGATARRYVENMYGERTDQLNAGVPTDRLIAEWPARPTPRPSPPAGAYVEMPELIRTVPRPDGEAEPIEAAAGLDSDWVRMPIPEDVGRLRRTDSELAERWRRAVAAALQDAFARGYRAVGFERRAERNNARIDFYLLQRDQS